MKYLTSAEASPVEQHRARVAAFEATGITVIDMLGRFPWYRCKGCRGFFTALQERKRTRSGVICACGANDYRPAGLRWFDWLRPSVWLMYVALHRGRVVVLEFKEASA